MDEDTTMTPGAGDADVPATEATEAPEAEAVAPEMGTEEATPEAAPAEEGETPAAAE